MNEPHALFQYKGRWHLFYQFNPAGPYWQNISWGHWVSDDMVNWKFVKEAVIPTQDTITPDGVWTGNVIFSSDGQPLLLITAGDDSRPVNGSNQHVGLVRAVDYDDPKSSLEIYIDDSIAISGTKYLTGKGLEVFADGNAEWSVTVTEMKSIHNES